MPRSLPVNPRKILPPPTTMTTSTPSWRTSPIWRAISWMASGQMPTPDSPPNASPLSLSKMRRYFGLLDWVMGVCEAVRDSSRDSGLGWRPHRLARVVATGVARVKSKTITQPCWLPVARHLCQPGFTARPGRNRSSADFEVCCIAGFQTRQPPPPHALPIWKSATRWKPAFKASGLRFRWPTPSSTHST